MSIIKKDRQQTRTAACLRSSFAEWIQLLETGRKGLTLQLPKRVNGTLRCPNVPFPQTERDGIDKCGEDVEEMVVQQRGAAEHEKNGEVQDPFRTEFADKEIEYLRQMKCVGKNSEQPAACQDLYKDIVIHVGEKPVFYIDIDIERRIEPDSERRIFQEIEQSVFPDLKAVGIAESPFEDGVEEVYDLFIEE